MQRILELLQEVLQIGQVSIEGRPRECEERIFISRRDPGATIWQPFFS
jgi:hypothetical protein